MGSDILISSSTYDEISMQRSLQFSDSLMDLRNLRKQLYTAAEHFESAYDKDEHKEFVVESSKEYVTNALVSTVDHLGSVTDKLSKFLDEQANDFSVTDIRFSCIEQKLNTYHRFVDARGLSRHSLITDTPKYHKRYTSPAAETDQIGKPADVTWRSCVSRPQSQTDQSDPISIAFLPVKLKPQTPAQRKRHSRAPSHEASPKTLNFSFSKGMATKDAGKRSASPLRLPLKRSESVTSRSVSPIRSVVQQRWPSQPRGATAPSTKPDVRSNREIESYTKRSKHLFKALLGAHRSRKDTASK